MRDIVIRLYENVISKFKNMKGWSKDIDCSIEVKQSFPLSHTFIIYIDKLEGFLSEEGCIGMTLPGIFVVLLLYA